MISQETILGAIEACDGEGAKSLSPLFVKWAMERALLWERMKIIGGVTHEEEVWEAGGLASGKSPELAVERAWRKWKQEGPLFGGPEQALREV